MARARVQAAGRGRPPTSCSALTMASASEASRSLQPGTCLMWDTVMPARARGTRGARRAAATRGGGAVTTRRLLTLQVPGLLLFQHLCAGAAKHSGRRQRRRSSGRTAGLGWPAGGPHWPPPPRHLGVVVAHVRAEAVASGLSDERGDGPQAVHGGQSQRQHVGCGCRSARRGGGSRPGVAPDRWPVTASASTGRSSSCGPAWAVLARGAVQQPGAGCGAARASAGCRCALPTSVAGYRCAVSVPRFPPTGWNACRTPPPPPPTHAALLDV